jgi:hypothetical protein
MQKMVNFDIAHALVNYVARDGDVDSLAWGNLSATEIRKRLCELKTKDNKVCVGAICQYLVDNQTCKLPANANRKIDYLRLLLKDASNPIKKHITTNVHPRRPVNPAKITAHPRRLR